MNENISHFLLKILHLAGGIVVHYLKRFNLPILGYRIDNAPPPPAARVRSGWALNCLQNH